MRRWRDLSRSSEQQGCVLCILYKYSLSVQCEHGYLGTCMRVDVNRHAAVGNKVAFMGYDLVCGAKGAHAAGPVHWSYLHDPKRGESSPLWTRTIPYLLKVVFNILGAMIKAILG